ncbi:MAG: hypothetical protein OIN83_03050 [Candidatus Methanoperedens sp.]|nr:hypothetical protein [Candidatus Methanoperedens sp.]
MGNKREMIVSNSGPLIHLAKAGRINLLRELFGKVMIPYEVKLEVIDRGKTEGMADAFLIENEVENGWIVVDNGKSSRLEELASSAGIDIGESAAIMLAKNMKCAVLIDDLAARRFAFGLGLQVVGSIGVLIRCAKEKKISKYEAQEALEKLGRVMWLSIDVYEDARKIIEKI